jgi:hypothetical protein
VVLVEEMVSDRLPVVVMDPNGVWHGLRHATDGRTEGLPICLLGGTHGDSGLREYAGAFVADWAIERGQPLVLDLSSMSTEGARRFVVEFADQVRFRAPGLMHLVLDEADRFVGRAGRNGSVIDLIRSSPVSGVGVTLVSQHAHFLRMVPGIDVLIAGRSKRRADREAIRKWVERRSGRDLGQRFADSLERLARDEVWLFSPDWLALTDKVRLRCRATYDGSRRGRRVLRPPPSRASAAELGRLRARLGEAPGWSQPPLAGEREPNPLDEGAKRLARGRPIEPLVLGLEETSALQRYTQQQGIPPRLAQRARIVLACAEGRSNGHVALELDVSTQTVGKWRRRFVAHRLTGLGRLFVARGAAT